MTYAAPISDMRFVLDHVVGLERLQALPGHEEVAGELVDAVLEQAGRLAGDVIAPTNVPGDRTGSVLENGVVRTPPGFQDAYRQFVEGGWNAVPFEAEWGGQGLPWTLSTAVTEMWQSANMSFSLCPLLTQGAIEALTTHGSDRQKQLFLTRLIQGTWTGTMNLTEPQAGSDLGQVRTKAERNADGSYRLFGQKIFITYGDHDLAENIVHLVLARTPDAPAGVKGISLFLAPKFLTDDAGKLGQRNDVRVVSLEHKLGIHGSPTGVMAYGDNGGCVAELIGEEGRGLEYMFTMMNNARLGVGLQGVAIAERAYQQARAYARDRVQGRALGSKDPAPVAIIEHPDVRRMLLTMRAFTEAARALTYSTMLALDEAKSHPDPALRGAAQARVDLLTPVVKAWCTDVGNDVASLGVQVHGGMGFIEETGAAQHLRDARILPIYEGTNGIQANDLVFRKVLRDGGASARAFIAEARALVQQLSETNGGDDLFEIRRRTAEAVELLDASTDWVVETGASDQVATACGAAPYLRIFGLVAGGVMMARAALAAVGGLAAREGDTRFLTTKLITARFYAEHLLPQAAGFHLPMTTAHLTVRGFDTDQF